MKYVRGIVHQSLRFQAVSGVAKFQIRPWEGGAEME